MVEFLNGEQYNDTSSFSYLSPLAVYYEEDIHKAHGHLTCITYKDKKDRMPVVNVRDFGGFHNRELALQLKQDLYEHFVTEFGKERVSCQPN